MNRVVGLALGLSAFVWAGGAIAAPCPDVLVSLPDQPVSLLEVALAAAKDWNHPPDGVTQENWATVRDASLLKLKEFGTCDLDSMPQPDATAYQAVLDDFRPNITDIAAEYAARNGLTIPFFSPILGPSSSVPAPQPLQVGLSQVVSAGQPGMSATVAGTPAATGESWFWRHFTIHGSSLVVQTPAESTGGAFVPGNPQFASADLAFSFTSRRTLYDWSAEMADRVGEITGQLDRRAFNSVKRMLETYGKETASGARVEVALGKAVEVGRRSYEDSARAYLEDELVATEARRDHESHWALSLQGRVSPRPDFVPELPDLISAGLQGAGVLSLGNPAATHFSLSSRLLAALSMFPTTEYQRIDDGGSSPSLLLDLSLDASVLVPSRAPATGRTRLAASFLLRGAPFREYQDEAEFSVGGNVVLEVPLSESIALAGTYTFRHINDIGLETISGLTIAKAFTAD